MDKSQRKTHPKKPFLGKGDPRNGRGPAKGAPNAGRPRDEWKAWLRAQVDGPEGRAAIMAVLQDPSHPAFATVLKWADQRGWGPEPQALEHSGPGGAPIVPPVIRIIAE